MTQMASQEGGIPVSFLNKYSRYMQWLRRNGGSVV